MKVLLATHFFPPGHPGGTESYTYGLARMLRRRGHAPFVICAEGWGSGDNWRPRVEDTTYDGIPVRRLFWNWGRAPDPFVNFYDNPEVEREFAAYVRELRPDVTHVTSCYSLGARIIPASRRSGVPVFLTLTDFWFLCPRNTLLRSDGSLCPGPESATTCASCLARPSRLYRAVTTFLAPDATGRLLLEVSHHPRVARWRGLRGYVGDVGPRLAFLRQIFDQVDVPLAPSRFLIDVFRRNGYPAERIRHSPYGLDLGWLSELRPRQRTSSTSFGYIGQIDPVKGVDVLVRAFQTISREVPAELKIYGDLAKRPSYGEELRRLANGNPAITFPGAFERSQIAEVLSGLDVVVVPSLWYENTPLVIGEAFAAGKPVIATNLGGMSEVVEPEVNGLLFERGDVAGLASAMRRLAVDPVLRDRLRQGIKPVRTIDEEAETLISWYGEVAGVASPGSAR